MSTTELYNGSILLDFEPGKHLYTINGAPVTSVTGVLKVINKPALMPWAALMTSNYWKSAIQPGESYDEIQLENIWKAAKASHRTKSSDAASIGTLVHDYAEQVALGAEPELPINEKARKGCQAFNDWLESHDVEFIESEFKVYSKAYNYVGTCDLDCMIDGKRTILDYKTSSGIYPEMHLQTAAYAAARIEELGINYEQRAIVLFNKKSGAFKVEYRSMGADYENDLAGFLGSLHLHRSLAGLNGSRGTA